MRIAVLATFIACSARPPSGSPPEVTTVAPDGLTIAQEPGLRDWVALTEFRLAKLTWTSPDRETITGRRLPARNLWPGDTWTLTAQFADDEQQSVSATVPPPPGGNVLIVLMDDVGVDKVGAYGAPDAPPTPTLDQLADLGQRFDRAYAAPVCSPTRGLLLTGRHARRTGVGWIADTGTRDYALPYDAVTIPEALWDTRGDSTYADAATGKWHLAGPNHPDVLVHANLSGFQWFSGLVGNPRYTEGWGYDRWSQNTNGVVETREGYLTSATIDDAIEQIETLPEPWFLYVPLNAPHTPWTEPPAELFGGPLPPDASDVEQYNAVLQAMDTELGRLVDALDEQWDRTTVIVMGDNGTPSHAVSGSRDPDRQKHSLFEGGVHVPLIVTGPHVAQPGAVSDALVHVADVMPTVAAIAGVPLSGPRDALELDVGDEVRTLDGQSWLPLLADPKAPGADLIYLESFLPHGEGPHDGINRRMVSDGDYKLVRTKNSEALYRIDPRDLIDPDGSDLLDRSLDGAAETAFTALTDAMDRLEAEVGYEGR